MIDEKHIKAMQELKKIMERHGTEISKSFEAYQKISSEIARSLKPFYDNMELIQRNLGWLRKVEVLPTKQVLSGLREMQDKISKLPQPIIKPLDISPTLLSPPINQDARLKRLMKQAINEYEIEELEQRRKESAELAKKRKVEGFGHGRKKAK